MDALDRFLKEYNDKQLLFRYRSVTSNGFRALQENRLYFSKPTDFNDPYDSLLYVNGGEIMLSIAANINAGMDNYLEKLQKWNPSVAAIGQLKWSKERRGQTMKEHLENVWRVIDGIKLLIRRNTKVICFSEIYASMLMWSHYADNHKGFILVYNKDDLRDAKRFSKKGEEIKNKTKLLPINYVTEQVDFTKDIRDYVRFEVFPSMGDVDKKDSRLSQKKLRQFAIEKSVEWAYEKEWRLIPRIIDAFNESPLEYIECKPRAIIIGVHCKNEAVNELKRIANLVGIEYFRMCLDEFDRAFQIKITTGDASIV